MTHLEKIKEIGGTMLQDEIKHLKPIETSIRPIIKWIDSGEVDEGTT